MIEKFAGAHDFKEWSSDLDHFAQSLFHSHGIE